VETLTDSFDLCACAGRTVISEFFLARTNNNLMKKTLWILIIVSLIQAAGMRAGVVLSSIVTVIASTAIAFACGWKLALCLMVMVPLIILLALKQQTILTRNINRDLKLMDNAGRVCRAEN